MKIKKLSFSLTGEPLLDGERIASNVTGYTVSHEVKAGGKSFATLTLKILCEPPSGDSAAIIDTVQDAILRGQISK